MIWGLATARSRRSCINTRRMERVTVLAATGRLGQVLVRRLTGMGVAVIAIGRDAGKLATLEGVETRIADFGDSAALTAALTDARLVVSCANAEFAPALLAALPDQGVERLVLMGSTRRFSKIPDRTAESVRRAEAALARLPIPSVMLLATMIYGAGGSVVDQLAAKLRRFPILPLPGGGRSLVQPIHIDDVAASLVAALGRAEAPGDPIVIAGPRPMTYAAMVRAVAASRGLRATILPVPASAMAAMAGLAGLVGPLRGLSGSLGRLVEDKDFDISAMRGRLGIEPREFEPGAGL
jgi:uncharacterized protein YbjT (DUF2867 family)